MKKYYSNNISVFMELLGLPLTIAFATLLLIVAFAFPYFNLILNLAKTIAIDHDYQDVISPVSIAPIITTQIKYPKFREQYAIMQTDGNEINNVSLYFGDDNSILKIGAGQSYYSMFPGEGGRIVISAHTNTYFRNIGKLKDGDLITVTTTYGIFKYKMVKHEIIKDTQTDILTPDKTKEQLILYTCYPFGTVGLTSDRYVIYADLESGPQLTRWEDLNEN